MFNSLLQFDTRLSLFISTLIPHNPATNLFFRFFSLTASSLPIWIVIVALLIFFEEKINKRFIIYLLISLFITSAIVFGLKNTVRRPRPAITISSLKKCDSDFSFPSGHTSIAFASATILAAFDKKRRWFYYIVAVLISFSRIYLQCHFILDVLGGFLIGYLVSKLTLKLSLRSH